jgi:hypothetical protein
MQLIDIKRLLEGFKIEVDGIKDNKVKEGILLLFNLVEDLTSTVRSLQEENQKLRDEISRLKGEQGKPLIRPDKKEEKKNISSEKERKSEDDKLKKGRGSKLDKIKIARSEVCRVELNTLPEDAKFKGYETVIVQDLKIETDNIEYKKEVYYSSSEKKTYIGKLPSGYEGEFGPGIKALVIVMKHICNISEPSMLEFFKNNNIYISGSSISRILTKDKDGFHQEKEDLYRAGLESTNYQQIDDTGARVNGKNYHTHIVCNEFYTAYFTTEHKDRLTIIDILRSFREKRYCFNEEALQLLEQLRTPKKVVKQLSKFVREKKYTELEVESFIGEEFPAISKLQKTRLLEAGAIASYHKEVGYPVVEVLLCDDAPQFKLITERLSLCWVHDGRHYKKIIPIIPENIQKVEEFLERYWSYYRRLLGFKREPTQELARELAEDFDKLFSTQTGYDQLDERIAKTRDKKEELLMVLKYPVLPLHNNESELGARRKVRERDVSLQTKTEEGTKASDTFLTIVQTAKKLGVNAYEYIYDRVSKKLSLPSLAEVIRSRSTRCPEFSDSS